MASIFQAAFSALRAVSRGISLATLHLGISPAVFAQPSADSTVSLDAARIETNQTGLKILAAWGALNTVTGIAGALAAKDEEARRFHQMNALWGGVNLALAGVGLFRAGRDAKSLRSPEEGFRQHQRDRRIFAVNTGLDVVYAGVGVYLLNRGNNASAKKSTLTRGYGKSLVLQGTALFLFDAAMWAAHGRNSKAWQRAMERVDVSENGVGLSVSF